MIHPKGEIEIVIKDRNGHETKSLVKNTVLQKGREALAASLARDYGASYEYYIDTMTFGTGGVDGSNNPKYIDASRTALFTPVSELPLSAVIDSLRENEVVFTSVMPFDYEYDPMEISEMALKMANGSLYSMATFPMVTKTADMQITWNWRVSFV